MSFKNLVLAASAVALLASPAGAAVSIVNNPALFNGSLDVITFDTQDSDTIAEVQTNYGVKIQSLDPDMHTFVTGPGAFSGIGTLSSNAFGSTFNGLISDISLAPDYSGSTLRSFDIDFSSPVSAFGLNIQGAGLDSHVFELFDGASNSLGAYSFAAAGLVAVDFGANGFFGFQVTGAPVARVRVIQSLVGQDFVAFDNLTFVNANTVVPEPASWVLMILGFGAVGAVIRRSRAAAKQGTVATFQ